MPHNSKDLSIPTVLDFSAERYAGVWFEFARTNTKWQADDVTSKSKYTYIPETGCLRLVITSFDCGKKINKVCGYVKPISNSICDSGKLKVGFQSGPGKSKGWMKYCVHWTDYVNFSIVSDCDKNLWILSRMKEVPQDKVPQLIEYVKKLGFDLSKIYYSKLHLNGTTAKLRVVHNISGGPNVDVYINGEAVLKNLSYQDSTGYLDINDGSYYVELKITGTDTVIIHEDIELGINSDYTIIAHGDVDTPRTLSLLLVKDRRGREPKTGSKLRFIHAAATAPPVDVWVDGYPCFLNVRYAKLHKNDYKIKPGAHELVVRLGGNANILLGPVQLNVEPGVCYNVIASGRMDRDDSPLSAIVNVNNSYPEDYSG